MSATLLALSYGHMQITETSLQKFTLVRNQTPCIVILNGFATIKALELFNSVPPRPPQKV